MQRHILWIAVGGLVLALSGCNQPSGQANAPAGTSSNANAAGPKVVVKSIMTAPFKEGNSIAAHVTLVNSGNAAATNVKAGITGTAIIQGDPEPAGMDALPAMPVSLPDMAPGATADLPPVNDRIIADEGDMRNFVSGQWVLWVMGRVEYDDANKQHHVSNFREYYDYGTNGYKAADKGNEAN
jgi:hypothetical protein